MAIDLLNLEPTKISRDLKGKYILAYGLPKIGKTSLVASFPKSLIFSFGCQVEVISPSVLREKIKDQVSDLNNKYATMQIDCTYKK